MVLPIAMLFLSNVFMTIAWYGHLKDHKSSPLILVVLLSWGIAFFEYLIMVPANRWGSEHFTIPQLKIMQEIITMIVFAGFSVMFLKQSLRLDYLWASFCMIGAAYFIFRGG